jgi:ABC-type dipeptide/oligopeptide/nickel transport system permease subunit
MAIEAAVADHAGHRSHRWMMVVCCIPMLVIAVALVATGVVGFSFVLIALGCTAIMAFMMRSMHSDDDNHGEHR